MRVKASKIFCLIFMILILGTVKTLGQDSIYMDLNQCLQYAKQNSIQIQKSKLNENSGYESYNQAKMSRLPNLNASVTQNFTESKNVNPVIGGFQTQSSSASNFSINSGISLYQAGFIKNDIQQKKVSWEMDKLNTSIAENDISLSIVQAYLNILFAGEAYNYLKEVVKSSEKQVERTETMLKAGSVAKADLIQMKSQLATDRYNLVNAENNLDQQITILKQLLEIEYYNTFQIVVPEFEEELVLYELPQLGYVVEKALSIMPEIESSRKNIEFMELAISKSKSSFYPSLSWNGSLSTGYSDNATTDFMSQLDNNFYQRVGFSLNIPIYNRSQANSAYEISKINLSLAQLNQTEAEKSLIRNVESTYLTAHSAQMQYIAAKEQLEASEASYQISENQFGLGMLNTIELIQEKNKLLNARQEYIKAKYNAMLNLLIVDFYMGIPIKF
jgi:outer membrane protein